MLEPQFFPQHELDVMRGQLVQWGGDLDALQMERVDAVLSQPVGSGEDVVRGRRKSVNQRCLRLKDELDGAVALLDAVQALQEDTRAARALRGLVYDSRGALIGPGAGQDQDRDQDRDVDSQGGDDIEDAYHESLRIPALDQLEPDWADAISLQRRLAVCALGRRYSQEVELQGLSLCDAVSE